MRIHSIRIRCGLEALRSLEAYLSRESGCRPFEPMREGTLLDRVRIGDQEIIVTWVGTDEVLRIDACLPSHELPASVCRWLYYFYDAERVSVLSLWLVFDSSLEEVFFRLTLSPSVTASRTRVLAGGNIVAFSAQDRYTSPRELCARLGTILYMAVVPN